MRYYEIYIHKVRLREYVRLCYPVRIGAVISWLAMQLGMMRGTPMTTPREEWDLDPPVTLAECDEPVGSSLAGAARQAEASGFVEPIIYFHRMTGFNRMPIAVGCLRARHVQGYTVLQAIHSASQGTPGILGLLVCSFLGGERTIATANTRQTFDRIPGADATYIPGADLRVLMAAHEQKLRSCAERPIALRNNIDMVRELEQLSERFFAHMAARGIMREVPAPT